MKKKYSILALQLFLLCGLTASAQSLTKAITHTPVSTLTPVNDVRKDAMKGLTPASTSPITQTPQGDVMRDVEWNSKACYPENGKVVWKDVSGFVPTIVTSGSAMYIYCPITQLSEMAKTWIKGEISADGSSVVYHTPQAYLMNNDGTMLYATRVSATTGKPESNTDLIFSYVDGNLTQTDGGLLAITDLQGNFYGYGDMQISVTKNNEQTVSLPEGAVAESYLLNYQNNGTTQKQTAEVAFVGSDVYFSNPVGTEDSWFKGTLEGNTVTVPTKQYMGSDSGFMLYLNVCREYTTTQTDPYFGTQQVTTYAILNQDSFTFTFDPDTHTLSSDALMIINAGKEELGAAYAVYGKPVYTPWTLQAATPATPSVDSFIDLTEYIAYGLSGCMIGFTIPSTDVDGNFIAQENLFYQIAYDGTPLEFYDTTYLPYYGSFADDASKAYLQCNGDSHQLQTANLPHQTITLQSFYVVGDDVYESYTVTYNVKDGSSYTDGITPVQGSNEVVGQYSLDGRQTTSLGKGVNVVRYADGTVRKVMVR